MKRKDTYSLVEIASWPETKDVILPNVQRGFVWKASQLENLWDSLLRGYPVGAFVLTPNKLDNEKFEMLDGQQRATAICLGFGKETFRKSKYRVFIDLDKPAPSDNREYVFRVITPSHPWGYQWTDNTKPLTAENKRKAMDVFRNQCGVADPFHDSATAKLFPYDASLPVPFEFFIQATIESLPDEIAVKNILAWLKANMILSNWLKEIEKTKIDLIENPNSKKKLSELSSIDLISKRVLEIYQRTKSILDIDNGQRIPALYLNIDDIDNRKEKEDINDEAQPIKLTDAEIAKLKENELEESDPIENLFVRLNDGGTPLRGDELNYSILKANIEEALQEKIEEACKGFMKPSRFISIVYRLFQHTKKYDGHDGLSLKIKPKEFQRDINKKQNKKDFIEFLNGILVNEVAVGKTLLQYARACVEFDKDKCTYGLPYLMVSSLADKAPEIMFLFLYRLLKNDHLAGDKFEFNTDEHKKMLGVLCILIWLGKSEKQRNYNKLLRNLWPAAESLNTELFWSSIAIQRAMLDSSFNTPPNNAQLKKLELLFTDKIRKDTDIEKNRLPKYDFGGFIDNMLSNKNRDLVLYAQRSFLDRIFKKDHFFHDDTDMPFDWDHISPNSFVRGLHNIPLIISQWYSSNGNYRAWPYSLNRMDQDVQPAIKLDPLNPDNYEAIEELENSKVVWQQFIDENKHLNTSSKTLSKDLLDWSFCDKEWANCYAYNLKLKDNWLEVYNLITNRNFNLIKVWYSQLKINDLVPKAQKDKFSAILNLNTWKSDFKVGSDKSLHKYLKENLLYEESITWISKPHLLTDNVFHFYLSTDTKSQIMIRNWGITFGLYSSDGKVASSLFMIPDTSKNKYYTDKRKYVNYAFTLSSHEDISYIQLIDQISSWLKVYPVKKYGEILLPLFLDSIKSNFKNK